MKYPFATDAFDISFPDCTPDFGWDTDDGCEELFTPWLAKEAEKFHESRMTRQMRQELFDMPYMPHDDDWS